MPHPICFFGAQVGLAASIGNDVPADIRLATPGFSRIMPKSSGGYVHTAPGNRIATAKLPPGMFWGEVSFDGPMTYGRDMLVMLAAGLGLPTPTPDGTNGQAWLFEILLNSALAPQFLVYENGYSARAHRALSAFVNSYTFELNRSLEGATQKYTGTMITGKKEAGVTITGSPDETVASIVRCQDFAFYRGATKAALDTAVAADDQFPIPLSVNITIPEMAQAMGRINRNENSYFARNEKTVAPTLALKATDDTDFDDLISILETDEVNFFALQALGDTIPGGTPSREQLRFNFCGSPIEPETPDEDSAAATNTVTFQNIYDPAWGKSMDILAVNDIPSLQP